MTIRDYLTMGEIVSYSHMQLLFIGEILDELKDVLCLMRRQPIQVLLDLLILSFFRK
jgi:hypothetical protein